MEASMAKSSWPRELKRAERLTADGQAFRIYMPYQYIHLANSPRAHTYLPINRERKPLGISGRNVIYEEHMSLAVVFASHPRRIKNVWYRADRLTLYSDEPASRTDYFERLGRLHSFPMRLFNSLPPTAGELDEMRRQSFDGRYPTHG
jgi:hypothetical protein